MKATQRDINERVEITVNWQKISGKIKRRKKNKTKKEESIESEKEK